jgi:molybdate/tungstate transport system substrate-binding protein
MTNKIRFTRQLIYNRIVPGSLLLAFLLGLSGLAACGDSVPAAKPQTKVVLFEAGSLMVPFAQVEKEFEAVNPDINLEIQAHGSIQVIRHVTELGEDVDVVAVADYSLIPLLMYQTLMTNGQPYADWYIEPFSNQLTLGYTENSLYAGEITADNWYEIISRPDVKVGLSDPRMDAVGYRTLMVMRLAEDYYDEPGLMANALGRYFTVPIAAREEAGFSLITVPELLEPNTDRLFLRGASMQLIALLQSNDIDYTFEYKSVVRQQNLKYLELPPAISLGEENFSSEYSKVRVKIDFRRFKSVVPEFEGLPIGYGITITGTSTKKSEAARLISFILSPDGQRIFNENHHPPLIPPECDNTSALPADLKTLFP